AAGVDSVALPDGAAIPLIQDAEELIDRLLGGWTSWDLTTGREVRQGDVEGWPWLKLGQATAKLAARMFQDPELLSVLYESERGPDFAQAGPSGGVLAHVFGVQVMALLDNSGLRRLAGRARPGRRVYVREKYRRFLAATRHDGT